MIRTVRLTLGMGITKDFGFNWAPWLDAATISTSVWAARGGVSVANGTNTDTATAVDVTTTKPGEGYEAINTITTSDGNTERARLLIDVLRRLALDGPMVVGGKRIRLVVGDDYLDADSRALVIEADTWPSLSGATLALSLQRQADPDEAPIEVAGVVVQAAASAPTLARVRFDLPTAETSLLVADGRDAYLLDVQATLSGGSKVTLYRDLVHAVAHVST